MATYISWIFKMHFCNLQPKAFNISKKKIFDPGQPYSLFIRYGIYPFFMIQQELFSKHEKTVTPPPFCTPQLKTWDLLYLTFDSNFNILRYTKPYGVLGYKPFNFVYFIFFFPFFRGLGFVFVCLVGWLVSCQFVLFCFVYCCLFVILF